MNAEEMAAEVLDADGVIRHYVAGGRWNTGDSVALLMLNQAEQLGRTPTGPVRHVGHLQRPISTDPDGRALWWSVWEMPTEPGILPEPPPCPMAPYASLWETTRPRR